MRQLADVADGGVLAPEDALIVGEDKLTGVVVADRVDTDTRPSWEGWIERTEFSSATMSGFKRIKHKTITHRPADLS